jgi:hypothetical protein
MANRFLNTDENYRATLTLGVDLMSPQKLILTTDEGIQGRYGLSDKPVFPIITAAQRIVRPVEVVPPWTSGLPSGS